MFYFVLLKGISGSFLLLLLTAIQVKADVELELHLDSFSNPHYAATCTTRQGFFMNVKPATYTCCDGSTSNTTCHAACNLRLFLCIVSSGSNCISNNVTLNLSNVGSSLRFGSATGSIPNPVKLSMTGAWTTLSKLYITMTSSSSSERLFDTSWRPFMGPSKSRSHVYGSQSSHSSGKCASSLNFSYKLYCSRCSQGYTCQTPFNPTASHHETCVNDEVVCQPGWKKSILMSTCSTNINECRDIPCQHGGQCHDTPGSYTCSCPSEWHGTNCEQDTDECLRNPCQHGGACHNTPGGFNCNCTHGWSGRTCHSEIDECLGLPCANGKCFNTPGSFNCRCNEGWNGQLCDKDINECQHSNPCHNAGLCHNTNGSFTCTCGTGFQGNKCETDKNECLSNPCNNHGTCINTLGDFQCICPQSWTSKTCDTDVDECVYSPCLNGGTCRNIKGGYNCSCTKGWIGDVCEFDENECDLLSPCQNGGTCVNTNGGYNCSCDNGWTDPLCADDIDECASTPAPCDNGATCVNSLGSFSCACLSGFTGTRCSSSLRLPTISTALPPVITPASSTKKTLSTNAGDIEIISLLLSGSISFSIEQNLQTFIKLWVCKSGYAKIGDIQLDYIQTSKMSNITFSATCNGSAISQALVNKVISHLNTSNLHDVFPNLVLLQKQAATQTSEQSWISKSKNRNAVIAVVVVAVVLILLVAGIITYKTKQSSSKYVESTLGSTSEKLSVHGFENELYFNEADQNTSCKDLQNGKQ